MCVSKALTFDVLNPIYAGFRTLQFSTFIEGVFNIKLPTKIYKTCCSSIYVKTVALKEDTYAELAALRAAFNFKSFDDVVRFLLSACRRQ